MSTLNARITALHTAIAAAINADREKIGLLSALDTVDKTNLVGAVNELKANAVVLSDGAPSTESVWSSDRVAQALTDLKDELLGGASGAFDTLKELEDALAGGVDDTSALLDMLANRVRVDAPQTFDAAQKETARSNIGAASADELAPLAAFVEDADVDYAAAFNAALA